MVSTWLLDTLKANAPLVAVATGGFHETPLNQLLPGQQQQPWHTPGAFTDDGVTKPCIVCLPVAPVLHPTAAFMGMRDYWPRVFVYASTWDGALVVDAMRQAVVSILTDNEPDGGKRFVDQVTGARYRVDWGGDGQGARQAQEYEHTLFDWVRLRVTTTY